jgi:hypothetical protein
MIEVISADPPGGHPAADAAVLVQNRDVPTFSLQRDGREQTRDAGSYDDAGSLILAHVW